MGNHQSQLALVVSNSGLERQTRAGRAMVRKRPEDCLSILCALRRSQERSRRTRKGSKHGLESSLMPRMQPEPSHLRKPSQAGMRHGGCFEERPAAARESSSEIWPHSHYPDNKRRPQLGGACSPRRVLSALRTSFTERCFLL